MNAPQDHAAPREFDIANLRPWIAVEFSRSGGPGGQNVNKVSTRVTLRFDFLACTLLSNDDRTRLRARFARRLSADGRIQLIEQQSRSQSANRQAAEQKLVSLLTQALHTQRPRRATRPTAGSKRRRLAEKKARGDVKQARRGHGRDE